MVPNVTSSSTEVSCTPKSTLHSSSEIRDAVKKLPLKYRREIVWPNVVTHTYFNVAALYGAYLMLTSAKILIGICGMYCIAWVWMCTNVWVCVRMCIDVYVQSVFRTSSLRTAGTWSHTARVLYCISLRSWRPVLNAALQRRIVFNSMCVFVFVCVLWSGVGWEHVLVSTQCVPTLIWG